VRQYNQLIALMDNWGTFQENLATARGSEGALQEQADIYAESWEAAQDRVRASAEAIYDSLIDDEFFIKLLNGFADVLESVNGLIEGMGGVKGVLMSVSSIFMSVYAKQMPHVLDNLKQNLMVTFGMASKELVKT
jgi:hypothetical protein